MHQYDLMIVSTMLADLGIFEAQQDSDITGQLYFVNPWEKVELPGNTSVWSKQITLKKPLFGHRFRVVPKKFTTNGIALQMQLFGSQAGKKSF